MQNLLFFQSVITVGIFLMIQICPQTEGKLKYNMQLKFDVLCYLVKPNVGLINNFILFHHRTNVLQEQPEDGRGCDHL